VWRQHMFDFHLTDVLTVFYFTQMCLFLPFQLSLCKAGLPENFVVPSARLFVAFFFFPPHY
jgi:hypothetical protein